MDTTVAIMNYRSTFSMYLNNFLNNVISITPCFLNCMVLYSQKNLFLYLFASVTHLPYMYIEMLHMHVKCTSDFYFYFLFCSLPAERKNATVLGKS